MHNYYKKYLEKIKHEIDGLVMEEVEAAELNEVREERIEMLLENHAAVECLLRKEIAWEPEAGARAGV